ncbi:hypothetical protein [Roseobacter phage RDJL3]|nr:hypothetical protein [Roseobacter phage RDJL3]
MMALQFAIACHPKKGQKARVRIHGTVPEELWQDWLGREMQLILFQGAVAAMVPWEGGEHGIRFRINKKGVFDATVATNHPVLVHIRRVFGMEYWGLSRLEGERAWSAIHLLPPETVKEYNPKAPHDRGTKSALERLLEAEQREWSGLLSRQELHNIATELRQQIHLEKTDDPH